jgi:hypothetical protein
VVSNAYWIFASGTEITTGVVLTLSLFRLPIKANLIKIIIYCFTMAIFHYNLLYVLELRHIVLLENIILFIVLFNTIINLPITLSALLAIIGVFISGIFEFSVVKTLSKSKEVAFDNLLYMGNILLITAVFLLVATSLIQYFKIGFLFSERYFLKKTTIRPYNYLVSMMLVIVLVLTIYLSVDTFHFHILPNLIFLAGGSIILIGYTYYQNKKALEDQYNQFTK